MNQETGSMAMSWKLFDSLDNNFRDFIQVLIFLERSKLKFFKISKFNSSMRPLKNLKHSIPKSSVFPHHRPPNSRPRLPSFTAYSPLEDAPTSRVGWKSKPHHRHPPLKPPREAFDKRAPHSFRHSSF